MGKRESHASNFNSGTTTKFYSLRNRILVVGCNELIIFRMEKKKKKKNLYFNILWPADISNKEVVR